MPEMTPLSVKVWLLRMLAIASLIFICWLADSPFPAWAFTLAWSPNGLFLVAFERGTLRLPHFLETVNPVETRLYSRLGVGMVKHIVASPVWPMMSGSPDPPEKPKGRHDFLDRTERFARCAEICHLSTFVLASCVALYYLATGRTAESAWILLFNMMLNGYPVMLQRAHRRRIQQVRMSTNLGNRAAQLNR